MKEMELTIRALCILAQRRTQPIMSWLAPARFRLKCEGVVVAGCDGAMRTKRRPSRCKRIGLWQNQPLTCNFPRDLANLQRFFWLSGDEACTHEHSGLMRDCNPGTSPDRYDVGASHG